MYQCVVVDDESLARERICDFINQQPGWQVAGEAAEFNEARELLTVQRPQLCFMDINIIGGSGVSLARQLRPCLNSAWVFTTAYSEFALQAFELEAVDYLLKPFEDNRLQGVLNKVEKRLDSTPHPVFKHTLAVRSIGEVAFVKVSDIIWIKGAANYVELHCGNKTYLHRESMANLQKSLDPAQFVRVHRSALVNTSKVASLTSELGRYSLLHLSNGDEVRIGQAHKDALFNQLGLEA